MQYCTWLSYSAGIGRTGTFIGLDYLVKQAQAENHIDVFRTVTDMRYQRTNFVQTDVSMHNKLGSSPINVGSCMSYQLI